MTAADGVVAGIDRAIDLSERSATELIHFTEALEQLYAQLMIVNVGSLNPLGAASFHVIASAREKAESIQTLMHQVHGMLEQWRMIP